MQYSFTLTCPETKPIAEHMEFNTIYLPLYEHKVVSGIKKKTPVRRGMLLATTPSLTAGDLHASVDGVIANITSSHIEITPGPVSDDIPIVEPVNLDGLSGDELKLAIKQLGIHPRPFTRPCKTFIINGLNPEPGMMYAEEMLRQFKTELEAGLKIIKRISNAEEYLFAVPEGELNRIDGASKSFIKPEYPNSLARPLISIITGEESSADITLVRLHEVFLLGQVATTGLPLTRTVLTVEGENFLVPLGASVAELLALRKITPEAGDSLILGGAMRGKAIANMITGICKENSALLHIKKGTIPPFEDNPCINCGACVHACPMRLRPNMLSRYAEFELYKECHKEYIELCIECGLCGYVCPACRPMQQYFHMAKHALGLHIHQHAKPPY